MNFIVYEEWSFVSGLESQCNATVPLHVVHLVTATVVVEHNTESNTRVLSYSIKFYVL